MNITRRYFQTLLAAGLGAVSTSAVMAQGFPEKPLKILVGAPPGGTSDIMARVIADGLSKELGQPVIVDNRAGGAGVVAMQELMKAPRDGHTLLLAISGLLTEIPHAFKLPVEPIKVLTPVVELARTGLLLVGNNNVPASKLSEVIAHVKANPGKISYASYTAGTLSHTLGYTLNQRAGIDMLHVPYRGSAPGLVDLVAGHVQYMFDAPASVLPFYKAGKLKVFATTSPQRNPALPEVPTFAELGYPEMTETPWVGMFLMPEVPAAVQTRLREALVKQLGQPSVRERWAEIGMSLPPSPLATPQAMLKVLQDEHAKQGRKLADIGFKPD